MIPLALDRTYTPSEPISDTPRLTIRFYPDQAGEAGGELRRRSTTLSARLAAAPRAGRTVRLTRTREPVTLWLPEPHAAPRRVTVGGVSVPRRNSLPELDAGAGWLWDPVLQRLLVRLLPGPARSIVIAR